MITLKSLKNTNIKAKRIYSGKFHSQNHDEFINYLHERITEEKKNVSFSLVKNEKLGRVDYIENDKNTNYYWLLPKIKKETEGEIVFRSNDYYFTEKNTDKKIFGEKLRKDNITEKGLIIKTYNDEFITYEFLK